MLTGCHPTYCKWEFGYTQLKKEPTRKSLIGEYELSEYSKSYLIKNGYQNEISKLNYLIIGLNLPMHQV